MKYSTHEKLIFTPAAATLDFSSFPAFDVRNLYAVVDVTAAAPIYLMGIPNMGYSALSPNGHVLTLQASMAGLTAADILAVTYDEGDDNLGRLVSLASGLPDITMSQQDNPPGLLTRNPKNTELLQNIYAAIVVLIRLSIVDKQVNDSDIDSFLNEEINKLGS